MCGINAIFAYGDDAPPVDRRELETVRDRMAARGPDGAGAWLSEDGRVGLGHRRLAIIDPGAAGAQPMALGDGDVRITFNGEIYNYRALREELRVRGHRFASTSDTEVLLRLYAEYGAEMVARLRGMYAFALWDGRRRGLLLARDPLGIKPLYVADDGRTLRLASQVKALLAGDGIDRSPEPAGHAGFFLWGHVPEPFTLFRGIRALPAGTTLWLERGGRRREARFFSVAETLASGAGARPSPGDPASALADSVEHHLVADVPVGVFLSAGLDSTTIAALAARRSGGSLRTVTLGFDAFRGTEADETALAAEVARRLGVRHEIHWIDRAAFIDDLDRILAAMDQPSTDGVNTYFVAAAARAAGLKVALSGLGGDELFAGYPSFRQVPRLVRLTAPLRAVPAVGRAFRRIAAPFTGRRIPPKAAGLLELGPTYGGAYLLRRGLFMPWELDRVLDPELAREGWRALETLARLERSVDGLDDGRRIVAALEMDWYMRDRLLRDSDWAGMAHSVEIRTPLVDAVLLARLAPLLAGPAPPGKREMAAAADLPPAVLNRPKSGFVAPVREWMMAARGLEERGLRGWARYVYRRCYDGAGRSER